MIYYAWKPCDNNYRSQHEAGIELRTRLFSVLGITDEVKKTEKGRPYIENTDCDFSVSHSKHMAICAVVSSSDMITPSDIHRIEVNGTRIGIDAEFIDPDCDLSRLKKISARYLKTEISSGEEFYSCWTRHEAFGKLCGEGLFYRSDDSGCAYFEFPITIDNDSYKISICLK